MNKKPTILAVAALGSLALIGTGFAGWVIVANATSTASGNITAYEVTDNRLTATGKWAGDSATADSGSIVFGKPSGASDTASTWFKSNGVGEEKLSDTYTLSIASKNDKDTAKVKVSAILNITEKDSTNPYKAALDNHWIAGPTLTYSETDLFKKDSSDAQNSVKLTLVAGKATADFAFTFAWGSHFGGENPQNPFTYYNDHHNPEDTIDGTGKTYGNDAAEVMGALGKINETKFSITFTIERVDNAA